MPGLYRAERVAGRDAALERLSAHNGLSVSTPFQCMGWLREVYTELAPAFDAEPTVVTVTATASGETALVLPLVTRREGGLLAVGFPNFGVSDYGAPILGPAAPKSDCEARALGAAVRRALADRDLLRLSSMPAQLAAGRNPLCVLSGARPSRHSANRLTVPGTLEQFVQSRGKKYRKEIERCGRLLAAEGAPAFRRATGVADVARAFAALEAQQSRRREEVGDTYTLDQPAFSAFYAGLLRNWSESACIYTLEAGGDIAAALLGIRQGNTFTILRISSGGARWQHLSPGRLVIIEAMRQLLPQGVTTFDMGIGDYPFKRSFGITPEPLVDVVHGLSLRGKFTAAMSVAKDRARRSPTINGLYRQLKSLRPGSPAGS